jgi:hypothetical protein
VDQCERLALNPMGNMTDERLEDEEARLGYCYDFARSTLGQR